MSRVLNVAEKPSVAKEISNILGNGRPQKRNGQSKFNPVFEFPFNLRGDNVTMVFTSVAGHMMAIDFPENYKQWQNHDPIVLFQAPIVKYVPENMTAIEKSLQKEIRGCQTLVLWLDCDREGENIAFEVLEVCKKVNPRINVLRAHFSAVIPRAVQTLTAPNANDSMAVDARMEIDLRVGAAFTRFQTMRFRNKFQGLGESIISYGPCQFPTLGFVVDRYWKIQNFIPEDFWTIECSIKKKDGTAHFNWKRGRLYDKLTCLILYELCMEQPMAQVIQIEAKPKKKMRPVPMTTVELQKLAARKLHLSSDQTMQIAEKLYQSGFISYPRTETDSFQEGTDFNSLIQMQTNDSQWGNYAASLLAEPDKFLPPRKGKNNDNSHPPIHPTKYTDSLNGKEKQLYEFIVRHFLACCSTDAVGQETVVTIEIVGEHFTAKGLMVEKYNWLEVYPYEKWTDKNIPVFKPKEQLLPSSLKMHEGQTTPPTLLSEPELIQLMDENGIGTDATIAQHIQTIQERGYVHKQMPGALFTPTTLGVALVDGYNQLGLQKLSKPQLRAETEADMLAISRGQKRKEAVIESFVQRYQDIFQLVKQQAVTLDTALSKYFQPLGSSFTNEKPNFTRCGKCSNKLSLRTAADTNRVLYCSSCKASYGAPRNGQLAPHNHTCPICNFQVISVTTDNNKNYTFCPYCRTNPPQNLNANSNNSALQFNCLSCAHKECPLAAKKNDTPLMVCPTCKQNNLQVRTMKESQKNFIGCKGFPSCKGGLWFPDSVLSASVSEITCDNCGNRQQPVHLLSCKFDKNCIPPGISKDYLGCVLCDNFLRETFEERNAAFYQAASSRGTQQALPSSPHPNMRPNNTATPNAANLSNSFNKLSTGLARSTIDLSISPPPVHNNKPTYNMSSTYSSYANSPAPPSFHANKTNQSNNYTNSQNNNNNASDSDAPLCPGHNLPCVLRTTQKPPNAGRQFYVCSMPQGQQCEKSFKWADEHNSGSSSSSSYSNNAPRFQNNNASSSGGGNNFVCFVCNEPGHFANACPQKQQQQKSFGGGGYNKQTSPTKKKFNNSNSNFPSKKVKADDGAPKSRKCGVCGQEGHNKRSCPNG